MKENQDYYNITSFEDAVREIGEGSPLYRQYRVWEQNHNISMDEDRDITAMLKLRIICEVLNGEWRRCYGDYSKERWYPFLDFCMTKEDLRPHERRGERIYRGLIVYQKAVNNPDVSIEEAKDTDIVGAKICYCGFDDSTSSHDPRLTLKSERLAVYCGEHFRELWNDYYCDLEMLDREQTLSFLSQNADAKQSQTD